MFHFIDKFIFKNNLCVSVVCMSSVTVSAHSSLASYVNCKIYTPVKIKIKIYNAVL